MPSGTFWAPYLAPVFVADAAHKWQMDPQILWGVFGTETSYGTDLRRSSAGAEGYMQFLPATARGYGVNVHDAESSIFGAAHYLYDLGVTRDPARATNSYSGGGGARYWASVKAKGDSWDPVHTVVEMSAAAKQWRAGHHTAAAVHDPGMAPHIVVPTQKGHDYSPKVRQTGHNAGSKGRSIQGHRNHLNNAARRAPHLRP